MPVTLITFHGRHLLQSNSSCPAWYICVIKACYRFHLSPVPLAEKRLMDVKLGELGSWLGGRDFTPNGVISALRRGEETCPDGMFEDQ